MTGSTVKTFDQLVEKIKASEKPYDLEKISQAYKVAEKAHEGQKRTSGDPYITHPLAVAAILLDYCMDTDTICAALLHDTVEDTDVTLDDLRKKFGEDVALMVDGVTKIGLVPLVSKEEQQAENIRKILMAMSKDIRVIIIKLADRLHNMRTLEARPPEKQRKTSLETMNFYAPIAHRLGMSDVKEEMEDIAIHYLDPYGCKEVEEQIALHKEERDAFIESIKQRIRERISDIKPEPIIEGRVKSIYSIYKKVYVKNKRFDEIYDIYAVRVIVQSVIECYNVLGIIHDMFRPIPYRFKDYIATPKPNRYQSLHTTVIGREGIPFEVQIRTVEMHNTAQYGVAAHWKYKAGISGNVTGEKRFDWIRQLLERQQEADDVEAIADAIKTDLAPDEVFAFTPKGDVISLPVGATVLDFAYSIHTQVGNKMTGAKVGGRMVSFDYQIKTGDIVEILTSGSPNYGPNRNWLEIARTTEAKSKIRGWFKKECREENIERGRAMFESELKNKGLRMDDIIDEEVLPQLLKKVSYTSLDEMYAAIGYGGMAATRAVNRMKDELARLHHASGKKTVLEKVTEAAERREQQAQKKVKPVHGVLVEGLDNCLIKFSRCCTPIPGDDIVGYITRGQGVSIHRTDCANYARREFKPEDIGRWINVSWADEIKESYATAITVVSRERNGLIMDIASIFNTLNTKVRTINARDTGDKSIVNITLETSGIDELRAVVNRISALPGVVEVKRNGGKR